MRAKVSLALAMAHEPELLVLDEPTSGLDAMVRREFLESMVDLAAGGQTVFLSSHQIGEVERVADIVAILREGKLLLVEPLDRLKSQTTEFTITLADGQHQLPNVPGQALAQRQRGRQWQVLVRSRRAARRPGRRAPRPCVGSAVEYRAPSLEEIFVAYMQNGRSAAGGQGEESRHSDPEEASAS